MTPPTLAGTRPWMERTRWEIIYQGFRRDILRSLTEMPCSSPRTDHVLGQRSNPADLELVSPQDLRGQDCSLDGSCRSYG